MVDLWRLDISIFLLAVLFAIVEIVSKYSESTSIFVFVVGIIGFLLAIIGSVVDEKQTRSR